MKQIFARLAPLIRQLPIAPDNGIANRTLRLSLHRAIHIPLKRRQGVNQ